MVAAACDTERQVRDAPQRLLCRCGTDTEEQSDSNERHPDAQMQQAAIPVAITLTHSRVAN